MPRKKLSARSVTEEVEVKGDEGELKLSNPTNESSEVPPTPITDGDEGCIICLETIKVRGEIDSCPHQFCFDCILKWSKVTNTCPVCKRNFLKVTEVQISQNTSAASSSGNGGKGKKKKKPKVVKIKPKPQRVEAPPMMPDFYAYDIRALFLHLTSMMWADDEDDSDYVDDDEDEEFQWAFTRYTPPSVEIPTVNLNDIYENGRHVIEILDDEDPEHDAGLFFNDEDDDEVQIISAPVGNSSRRGRRGESLFAPVGSSSYRAARQRITTSGSGRAAPPQLNSQRYISHIVFFTITQT